jgi:hypothetical protein
MFDRLIGGIGRERERERERRRYIHIVDVGYISSELIYIVQLRDNKSQKVGNDANIVNRKCVKE